MSAGMCGGGRPPRSRKEQGEGGALCLLAFAPLSTPSPSVAEITVPPVRPTPWAPVSQFLGTVTKRRKSSSSSSYVLVPGEACT